MFTKYNAVLRGLQSKVQMFRERFDQLCQGNRYTTTLTGAPARVSHVLFVLYWLPA